MMDGIGRKRERGRTGEGCEMGRSGEREKGGQKQGGGTPGSCLHPLT